MRVFLDFYLYFCHAVQSSAMPVVATRRLVKNLTWQKPPSTKQLLRRS